MIHPPQHNNAIVSLVSCMYSLYLMFVGLQSAQAYFAIGASIIAMISGGLAGYYYWLSIKEKLRKLK